MVGYKNSEADSDGCDRSYNQNCHRQYNSCDYFTFNPSVDKTETIEILQPIPTTTITTSYIGISTSYETLTEQLVLRQSLSIHLIISLPLLQISGPGQLQLPLLILIPLVP